MEIEYLKTFLAVAKYKHFSVAAQELYISQSSLSKQIKSLEKELKISLFERTTRNVDLTPAGEDFKIYAENMVDIYDNMKSKMKFHSNNSQTCITVASITVATQYKIPIILSYFKRRYPNIKVKLIEKDHGSICRLLDDSKVDIAVITSNIPSKDKLRIYPIVFDELCLVVSKSHPLANREMVEVIELRDEEFILLSKSSIHDDIIKMCSEAGFIPNISHDNSKLETVVSLVSEDLGITIVTRKVIKAFNDPNVKVITIKNTHLITTVLAINNSLQKSKEIQILTDFILEWFRIFR